MTKAPERVWAFLTNDADDPGYMFGSCWTRERDAHEPYVHNDHALALVATAKTEIADEIRTTSKPTIPPSWMSGREGDLYDSGQKAAAECFAGLIMRTMTDDATAALKARDQRIRNEALREALAIAEERTPSKHGGALASHVTGCAIQAGISKLITEGQSDA